MTTRPADHITKAAVVSERSVDRRLNPALAQAWAPIPHALIFFGYKLGIKPAQFAVITYLLARRWDAQTMPHPAVTSIAQSLGLAINTVRSALQDLDERGLVLRVPLEGKGSCKHRYAYDLDPLLDALTNVHDAHIAGRLRSRQSR